MNLENKKFVVKVINAKAIEGYIRSKGYEPIRWAMVEIINKEFVVEAACFKFR